MNKALSTQNMTSTVGCAMASDSLKALGRGGLDRGHSFYRSHAGNLSRAMLVLLLAAGHLACASNAASKGSAAKGKAPTFTREQSVREFQRRFPEGEFIVGIGSGDNAEQAELRAASDAAARIRSEISSNIEVVESSDQSGYASAARATVVQKANTELGALIRPVRELGRRLADGSFLAVAVASRAELDEHYAALLNPLFERLLSTWSRALNAGEGAPQAASLALCEAEALEKEVASRDLERRLVTRNTVWTEESLQTRQSAAQLRDRLKGQSEIQVLQSTDSSSQQLIDSVLRSMREQGYVAKMVDRPACKSKSTLVLRVDLAKSCSDSAIGVRCEARMDSRVERCQGGGVLFEITSESARAHHANDRERASARATQNIDLPAFADTVSQRLGASLGASCAAR